MTTRIKSTVLSIAIAFIVATALVFPTLAEETPDEKSYSSIVLSQSGDEVFREEAIYTFLCEQIEERANRINLQQFKIKWNTEYNFFVDVWFRAYYDHPEAIDLLGTCYIYQSGAYISHIELQYKTDLATEEAKSAFESAVQEALCTVEDTMTDLEKALIIHDHIVSECEYDYNVSMNNQKATTMDHNPYGCLVDNVAVCDGYAKAYKIILDRLGIPCIIIRSPEMNHAWNAVCIDGEWYHVDLTWDEAAPNQDGRVEHDYFLISDEKISKTHRGWETRVVCASDKYESGYAFNNVDTPFYYYNGRFYYIRDWMGCVSIYSGSLDRTIKKHVATIRGYYRSAVWQGTNCYYVNGYYSNVKYITIRCVDIESGETEDLSEKVDFLQENEKDMVGLRLSEDKAYIEAVSSVKREIVLSVDNPCKTPEESETPNTTTLKGFDKETGKITIFWAGHEKTVGIIVVKFFRDGKLCGAQMIDTELGNIGWVTTQTKTAMDPHSYTSYEISLVDGDFNPLCVGYEG